MNRYNTIKKDAKRLKATALLLFLLTVLVSPSHAQEHNQAAAKPDVEMLTCRVKVVDPNGFPVEGATVSCTGIHSKESPNGTSFWSSKRWGKLPRISTDADGIATMPYPRQMSGNRTTAKIRWKVEHPDFVLRERRHSVDEDPAIIKLQPGFRIAITAVDAVTGKRIVENLIARTCSAFDQPNWTLKKNGTLVSNTIKNCEGIIRVACFQDDNTTLFSDIIRIEPGDRSRVFLKDIRLSVGCRVEGQIDDSVARPIRNGHVSAQIVKVVEPHNWISNWHWSDDAEISPDGTFVFESLPSNEHIQLMPFCDGWVPAKPDVNAVIDAFPNLDPTDIKAQIAHRLASPQVFKVGDSLEKVNLEMAKACNLSVKVINEDGEPIESAIVATTPMQTSFVANGVSRLRSRFSSRFGWKLKMKGFTPHDLYEYRQSQPNPFTGKTDENGIFVIRNLPPGKHKIFAGTDSLEMQKDPASGRHFKGIKIENKDHNMDLSIQLFPKGSIPEGAETK